MIKRIVKLLIAIVFQYMERIGVFRWNDNLGSCTVLMYHDVTAVNYHRFVRQMEQLKHLAKPVATDSIRRLKRGKRYIAITFDDGFASTIELVLPVLILKDIPATFFIPAAMCGREAEWITDIRKRERVGRIISVGELRTLSDNVYVIIGSHSMNHVRLKSIMHDEIIKEYSESKKILEEITGKEITSFSFPYGDYNYKDIKLANEAGYRDIFSIKSTSAKEIDGVFVHGRMQVDPTDWPIEFRLKVMGAYRWMSVASFIKKRCMQLFM